MENFLIAYKDLHDCFNASKPEDFLNLNEKDMNVQCLQQRITFSKILNDNNTLKTSNLIHERLDILKIKEHERAEKRKNYLNTVFK